VAKFITVTVFLLALFVAAPAQAQCLSYVARVRVEGTLERKTFPGPPNYESVAAGDVPERVWLLRLDTPACVAADRTDSSGVNAAVSNLRAVQLLLTDVQYRTYAKWVGGRAVLTGKLFGAITAHHHTPVLLDMVQFSR